MKILILAVLFATNTQAAQFSTGGVSNFGDSSSNTEAAKAPIQAQYYCEDICEVSCTDPGGTFITESVPDEMDQAYCADNLNEATSAFRDKCNELAKTRELDIPDAFCRGKLKNLTTPGVSDSSVCVREGACEAN